MKLLKLKLYEREMQKKNQSEFAIEKVIKIKVMKCMLNERF